METAIERLALGLRINGAKDDAAGQAIAKEALKKSLPSAIIRLSSTA